jgi:3-oxoacyl-[acyl-carrier-protein] synthase II
MAAKRVVITGLGIIASNGIGKAAFSDALMSGVSGIKPVTLFDTAPFKVKTAAEATGFDPKDFLGEKGHRTLDRSTKLVASATKLALDDAGVSITEENTHDAGVAIGTALGSLKSISDFDKEAIKEGPRFVNPALFPNTVINSPASQVAIKFNIKGFNSTVSTGFAASLDAINYAVDFLKLGRAKIVLAGGVEELCLQTFIGFYKTGFMAGLDSKPEISCPFDKRRNGIILGEGATVAVLEDLESALARKAEIYAEIIGFGSAFDAYRINKFDLRGLGLRKAMRLSLEDALVAPSDIDFICASANSTPEADLIETESIKDVFASQAKDIPVSSIKSMIGECFSASGAFQVAAAVSAINKQMIPPTINYKEKDPDCDLDYVVNQPRQSRVDKVLVNAFGPNGCNSSMVVAKFEQ